MRKKTNFTLFFPFKSVVQTSRDCSPGRQVTMSGGIFDYHKWWWGGVLLASSG